jgi:hypothetical protein
MTATDTLTVVKLLARGRPIPFVAEAVGLPGAQVAEIGGEHGWPDRDRLRDAARALERADLDPIALANTAPIPPAPPAVAEVKRCSKCRTTKPVSAFHVDRRRPDGLCSQCKECMRQAPSQRNVPYTPSRAVRTRARQRAMRRLTELHPRDYERIYAEEVDKARDELGVIKAVADETGKGASHTARHDPVQRRKPVETVPLLRGGPLPAGQTITDRLRDDVGRCPLCIDSHDRGHTCPACGSQPDTDQTRSATA